MTRHPDDRKPWPTLDIARAALILARPRRYSTPARIESAWLTLERYGWTERYVTFLP